MRITKGNQSDDESPLPNQFLLPIPNVKNDHENPQALPEGAHVRPRLPTRMTATDNTYQERYSRPHGT